MQENEKTRKIRLAAYSISLQAIKCPVFAGLFFISVKFELGSYADIFVNLHLKWISSVQEKY
jgi:hypothetical protein